ncbi:MAG: GntR family transcriptional regulator [Candidatus Latescibacteria bacterium]|jgi:GntR family transcriptional regulator|nr:GntR family transcriptional regulator [Candidatus Latescibacterota bacterium]
MRFHIDPDSGVPVYLQISQNIKRSIALGSLRGGEQVPSVREVAEMLTVNPNTVAKAYQLLEREGIVATRKGVGTFVTDGDISITEQERRKVVSEKFDRALVEAEHLRLARDEIEELFGERLAALYEGEDTKGES